MKAVVIGAGEVGLNIARHLVMEDHDVVVVDNDTANLRHVSEQLDVQTIEGMGSHPTILEQAGCDTADILIAVTQSDESNMIACQMGYSLFDVPLKIARVRDASYLSVTRHGVYTPENMPVDVIISPEREVSNAIVRTLEIPGAFDAAYFANNQIAMIGVKIQEDCDLCRKSFKKLSQEGDVPFVAVAIIRRNRLIVPYGSDHLEVGDELFFVTKRDDVPRSMSMIGYEKQQTRRAFVIGGGNIGFGICKRLEEMGMSVRVLEQDRERAEFLADVLDNTTVLHGDALDRDILEQESITSMDVVVCATSNDSANALSSILCKQLGAQSVITLAIQQTFISLGESLGLDKIVSPREITASRILQHIRRGQVHSLHAIHGGKGEIVEVKVRPESALAGVKIADLGLPEGVIIGAVLRENGEVLLPTAQTKLIAGDQVIVFSATELVSYVEQQF